MKVSISDAARRVGVRRNTIYRKIDSGKLSKEIGDDGQPCIDLSELARVYPRVVTAQWDNKKEQRGAGGDNEINTLRELVDVLKHDKERLTIQLEQERSQARDDLQRER